MRYLSSSTLFTALVGLLATLVPTTSSAAEIVYSRVLNTGTFDSGEGVTVDTSGNAYVMINAYTDTNDAVVLKLGPDGTVIWSSWFAAGNIDELHGMALAEDGDLFVVGRTLSPDFPVVDAFQETMNGFSDAFAARISAADGSLVWSTFLGGSRAESGNGIAVDPNGNVVITGRTDSTDFPTVDPFQDALNLTLCFCDDLFVSRLSGDGQALLYSSYLGGGKDDKGLEVGIDAAGEIYLAGETASDDFPLAAPLFGTYSGGEDAFVVRLAADGATLAYATYLGGAEREWVRGLRVDVSGNAYLVGSTRSSDFPTTPGAFQEDLVANRCGTPPFDEHICDDVWVTKVVPDGSALAFSTYVGGEEDDLGRGLAVDAGGRIFLVGHTDSPDFPGTNDRGRFEIFVSVLVGNGSRLRSVKIDSPVANDGHGVALGPNGDLYVTAAQNVPADTWVARIDP